MDFLISSAYAQTAAPAAAPNPLLCVLKYFPEELSNPLVQW